MRLQAIKQFFYALYLTNSYGWRLRKHDDAHEKKRLRTEYSHKQLEALNLKVRIEGAEHIPASGQYLLVSNHRTIIDPPLIEVALEKSEIFGLWISKKELYNSPFFGSFVRHAGTVLLDREEGDMKRFFTQIGEAVRAGHSIFIFPEGTRNKSDAVLLPFKDGAKLIARKNRLPILPVYLDERLSECFAEAIVDPKREREVVVRFGETIDYREKMPLEESYRHRFNL